MLEPLPAFEFCLAHRIASNTRRHRVECLDRIEGWLVWTPLGDRETEKLVTAPDRETLVTQLDEHLATIGDDPRSSPPGTVLAACTRQYLAGGGRWRWCGGVALVELGADGWILPKHVQCPRGILGGDRGPHLIEVWLSSGEAVRQFQGDWRRTNTLAAAADEKQRQELQRVEDPRLELSYDELLAQRRIDRERRQQARHDAEVARQLATTPEVAP